MIGEPPQGPFPRALPSSIPTRPSIEASLRSSSAGAARRPAADQGQLYFGRLPRFLSSPVGRFKSDLMKSPLGLYDPEYIDFNYPTSRDGGDLRVRRLPRGGGRDKEGSILDRAEALRSALKAEFALIAADPAAYFGAAALEKAKAKLDRPEYPAEEFASPS